MTLINLITAEATQVPNVCTSHHQGIGNLDDLRNVF